MNILAYSDGGAAVVEVFDVIDLGDQQPTCAALCAEVEQCVAATMIVTLCDPLITVAALHVLVDAQDYARSRGIALQAIVAPSAEHIFHIANLDRLLQPAAR
ncbi:hypothetical protein [Actinacidiphila acidipaludis]|uniref:STAS domain-containing protein n=1 Tax=Actinacidiphila acidipaludis TaxID=2873382 RepID=A0ABS7Q2F1_9ACTN|nr:hypothetical protein [Streptomyces acidipaludis]MBY8877303.1 hypothetical protein [Streptomyces acidipaludis]